MPPLRTASFLFAGFQAGFFSLKTGQWYTDQLYKLQVAKAGVLFQKNNLQLIDICGI